MSTAGLPDRSVAELNGAHGTSRPKVTYLLSDLGGGTGHHLISVLRSPRASQWSADIVSEVGSTVRTDPGVAITVLETAKGIAGIFPLQQIRRWFRLAHRFRRNRPDVVHAYFFWSIVYGRLLRLTRRIPRLVENREDLGFNWSPAEYAFLRATRSIPDRVICVSEAVRKVVIERERPREDRVVVIRNGVGQCAPSSASTVDALRAEFGVPSDVLIVGMVANFQRPIKGASYFVDSLSLVNAEVPGVRFMLIGMGRNQRELQRRADEAGVGSKLIFTGFRYDIDRLYDLMDVSVLTSLSEGLSITLLESMRHGVPVVATDVGGNREIVRDGETGYLVAPKDVEDFARRVVELLNDPVKREAFGRRAREVVKVDFDVDRVADAYSELYRELAALGNRGPTATR